MKTVFFTLLFGLAGGTAAGYFGRPAIDHAVSGMGEFEGEIVEERREDDRLVLTLRSGDETIQASFRERADDVEDLVTEGDTLTVRVGSRGVFADDVPIVRLRRAVDGVTEELEGTEEETAHASTRHRRGAHGDVEGEAEAEGAAAEEGTETAEGEADAEPGEEPEHGEAEDEHESTAHESHAAHPEEHDAGEHSAEEEDDAEADAEETDPSVIPPIHDEAELAAEIHRRARARRHRRRAAARARAAHASEDGAASDAEDGATGAADEPIEETESSEHAEPVAPSPPPVAEAEPAPAAAHES